MQKNSQVLYLSILLMIKTICYRYTQLKEMCILFVYNGSGDAQCDYSLILISNRDEYYDRPTQNMTIWSEDPVIVGGCKSYYHYSQQWLNGELCLSIFVPSGQKQ